MGQGNPYTFPQAQILLRGGLCRARLVGRMCLNSHHGQVKFCRPHPPMGTFSNKPRGWWVGGQAGGLPHSSGYKGPLKPEWQEDLLCLLGVGNDEPRPL